MNPLSSFNEAPLISAYELSKIQSQARHDFAISGNFADEFHLRLTQWINDFHRNLEDDFEVGGQFVTFGQTQTFTFTSIGYWNPSLISFRGLRDDGSPIELIQHVSQISVLLVRMKRHNPDEPKRPIGFASWDEYDLQIAEWENS
ncbi:TPA: hypothetical protein PXN43_000736 [Yersinia enterocolitica]|nr:hypothetical protein [Yersinia enterocolitica]